MNHILHCGKSTSNHSLEQKKKSKFYSIILETERDTNETEKKRVLPPLIGNKKGFI